MVEFIKEPNSNEEVLKLLNPPLAKWFKNKFKSFSESQKYAIKPIHQRKNVLVSAPTGGGKTLCAFTSVLDHLVNLAQYDCLEDKVYCIYVSPLKALSRDIEVNLKEPLKEIEKIIGKELGIRIGLRTGDTPSSERTKMLKKPPHILITTPESLGIILSSKKFVNYFKAVEFVVIDEIHSLASNKRGVHLSLSLERLNYINEYGETRIGLSATVAPLEEVASFLVGYTKEGKPRDCLIADIRFSKKTDLKVLSPVSDLIENPAGERHHSMYSLMDNLIQNHKSTLIFTNTRSATERVINHLKEKFPKKYVENIGAHHSSLSKELRYSIEDRLRKGELKVVVSSTSLELGIDIGYVDLVILLGSPKSVARGLQRIGRSGHKLHATAKGRFVILDRDDLVECSVLLKEALEKHIDKIKIPTNCLDVLSQHIYGMAIQQKWDFNELKDVVRQSYCYHNLSNEEFYSVISYLSGNYPGLEAKNVYAKIWYDPDTGMIGKKGRLARVLYMTNIGTIPDESFIKVVIAYPKIRKGEIIGSIDEGFFEKLRKGDIFVLGGQTYKFLYSRGMKAYVNASVTRAPTIPSWFSQMLPLSFDLAIQIQKLRRRISEKFENNESKDKIKKFIEEYLYVDKNATEAIYNYFREQHKYIGIPHLENLIIEYYTDNDGKNYRIFHTLFGRRVNDALSRALAFLVAGYGKRDIELGINDNGFYLASHDKMQIEKAIKELNTENFEDILAKSLEKTMLFKRRFRHCAARSLMILRNYKGRRKSVGKQQMKSRFLLGAVKRLGEDFPILKETKREVLEDMMDATNAKKVLERIKKNQLKINKVTTTTPSPFSFNLLTQGKADLLKMEDKIDFLKRMHREVLKKIKNA